MVIQTDLECLLLHSCNKILLYSHGCSVAQSCLTLCNPMGCSPPVHSVHGISQARILEWVAISFSRRSSQPRDRTRVSCIIGRCFILPSEPPGKPSLYTSLCNYEYLFQEGHQEVELLDGGICTLHLIVIAFAENLYQFIL